jgi:hypothetical protein
MNDVIFVVPFRNDVKVIVLSKCEIQLSLILSVLHQIISVLKVHVQEDLSSDNIKDWESSLGIV